MLSIYLPIFLIVAFYSLYYYFSRNFNYWKKKNVPGPKPTPFYGNLKQTALRKKNISVAFEEFYNAYPKEKYVGLYRMTTPCLLIRDLDIIKQIMIKDFDLFQDRGLEFSKSGLGQNLFHADGDTWSALRTRFTPVYTSGNLKNMFPLISSRANVFINHLVNKCKDPTELEMHGLVQKYTVSTIFACAFGVDIDYFHSDLDDGLKAVDKMVLTPTYANEFDMMYPGILRKLNVSIFPAKAIEFFENLVSNIITQRNGKPSGRGDFMDLVLQLRQKGEVQSTRGIEGTERKMLEITDDIIAGQAFVFYVGGYETSATTVAILMYYLAMYPEVQEKIIEEVDRVTAEHGGEITYDCLQDMKYLEKAFKETLRINPIVDPLQRQAKVNYKVPGTDLVIEKGQVIFVSARGIQRDEKYYPKPEVFDPSRFDSEIEGARHSCAYLPFGTGPRNCIGMRFGIIQSRMGVAKILSKFRVEACSKTELKIEPNRIISGPENGIHVRLVPRKSSN